MDSGIERAKSGNLLLTSGKPAGATTGSTGSSRASTKGASLVFNLNLYKFAGCFESELDGSIN